MTGSNRLAGLKARPKDSTPQEVRRVDEIGEAFDLRKIDLAVLESPARELSRLRHAQARDLAQRIENGADDGPAAMRLELGDIFARFAIGVFEP